MLIHVVGILIQNSDGDFLMCHPTNHPDVWSLPKGHVEDGEDSKQAAIRETKEETNLDILSLDGTLSYLNEISYKINGGKDTKQLQIYIFRSNVDLKKENLDIRCISYFNIKGVEKFEMDAYEWFTYERVLEKGMRFLINFFEQNKNDLVK